MLVAVLVLGAGLLHAGSAGRLSSGPSPFPQSATCFHSYMPAHVGAQYAQLAAESFVLSSDYPLNAGEPSNQCVY